MNETLKQAFDLAATLPDQDQVILAGVMIERIREEKSWNDFFRRNEAHFEKLAQQALAEHKNNLLPLDPDKLCGENT